MKKRIGQGWGAFCKLDNIKRDKYAPMRLRWKAFNKCILPIMTYGCETWSLTNTQLEKLVTTQRKMERIMVGVTFKNRKITSWIRKQSGMTNIIRNIMKSKHRWADHLARRHDNRWTESQNMYPVDIKYLEADEEWDGATTWSDCRTYLELRWERPEVVERM